ncbi:MAG: hypothetical protein ABIJ16_12095 [Bacteroidota bacterium]
MKYCLFILFITMFCFSRFYGQEMHTPAQLLEIMDKSTISYELSPLDEAINTPDREHLLNFNNSYRVFNEGLLTTYYYDFSEEVTNVLQEAEQYFQDGKIQNAREKYLQALEMDSTCYKVMTYIGQTYGIEKEYEKAKEWYTRTIELNYIDYMAHWFLADIYKSTGEYKKALDEITIAHILNRNNPRIKSSLIDIYKLNKLKYADWMFNPQVQVDSIGPDKVNIAFHPDWLGYGIGKAIWKYEPDYAESMGSENEFFSMLQEKECLVCLIVTFDKKKLKKYPEFKALQMALDNKMVDEYILFEILLPDYPVVAYQFTDELVDLMKNYIIKVRGGQK